MEAFKTIILIINIFSALSVIVLVLMQQGKGADAGAAFGSGSAQGVFGAAGSANFLSRGTAIGAAVFFATCLALGYISTHGKQGIDFSTVTSGAATTQTSNQSPAVSSPAASAPAGVKPVIPE